jgi:hypothetical protein
MICLQIFYFILILLIVPYDLLYFSFLNCYPIMFYVSFSLRFGLNCFHPTPFLKNGRIECILQIWVFSVKLDTVQILLTSM